MEGEAAGNARFGPNVAIRLRAQRKDPYVLLQFIEIQGHYGTWAKGCARL